MQIEIPYLAKEVKDEGVLILLGLFKQINLQYGHGTEYHFHARDIRTILRSNKKLHYALAHEPIFTKLIKIGQYSEDEWSLQYYPTKIIRKRLGIPSVKKSPTITKRFYAELTEEKSKLTWVYLLGCLNRNLITNVQIDHYAKSGLPSYFKPEFKYHSL
jgi:hypothetical protein